MSQTMHIERHKSGDAWRTSVRIDPSGLLKGDGAAAEIARIDIDENGTRVLTTRGGRQIPIKGNFAIRQGAQGTTITQQPSSVGGVDVFDVLGTIVFSKAESTDRIEKVSALAGARLTPRNGRLVHVQNRRDGTAEVEYDASSGLALRARGPASDGAVLTIDNSYTESGGLLIRSTSRNTLTGGKHSRVTTVSVSHITVNGKEIVQ